MEVGEGEREAFAEGDLWLPAKQGAGFCDVWAATGGVVLGEGLVDDCGFGAGDGEDLAAHSSMVNSVGLPRLTGSCSDEAARRRMPSMRSET